MLENFFQINSAKTATRLSSPQELITLVDGGEVSNAYYEPPEFRPLRPKNVIKKKTFRNVNFSNTVFIGIEFRKCVFEDCLFLSSEFDRCEFHHCKFTCCNLQKVRFVSTYVDPFVFIGVFNPQKHANIGVHVFQQLRSNALNTHQPDFFQTADWQFRVWSRHEWISSWRRGDCKFREMAGPVFRNWIYGFFLGYGHSLRRFAFWSAFLFVVLVSFNSWFWPQLDMDTPDKIDSVNGNVKAIYFTLVTLTTLGYGDITPTTAIGMLVAGSEALLGLVWFGMLTSIIVKKVFR
jgi:hypothetical protein